MIDSRPASYTYSGDGSIQEFAFPSPIGQPADIKVSVTFAETTIVLAYEIDYEVEKMVSVSEQITTGLVRLKIPAPSAGSIIQIWRSTPISQEYQFENQGVFFAKSIEGAVDKLTMISQEIQNQLGASGGSEDELRNAIIRLDEKKADKNAVASALEEKAALTHADRHTSGGEDPIAPASIGAMSIPPNDGQMYAGMGDDWVAFTPGGGGEGGTSDHDKLTNKNLNFQHKTSTVSEVVNAVETSQETINTGFRGDISDHDTRITANAAALSSQGGHISELQTRMSEAEENIQTLSVVVDGVLVGDGESAACGHGPIVGGGHIQLLAVGDGQIAKVYASGTPPATVPSRLMVVSLVLMSKVQTLAINVPPFSVKLMVGDTVSGPFADEDEPQPNHFGENRSLKIRKAPIYKSDVKKDGGFTRCPLDFKLNSISSFTKKI